jgi:sulfur relay (sulfurtransferase) DsrF/TusC family protein
LSSHPKEFIDLNFEQFTNRNLVVYNTVKPDELEQLFKKSIDLLNIYDTIYFTSHNEVADFVIKKGIFKFVKKEGFEGELQGLQNQRKMKLELTIDEFEKEKGKLEEDRTRLLDEYNRQIKLNKKLHEDNKRKIEESEKELNNISRKYDNFFKKIEESVIQLKTDQKPEFVKRQYNESKKKFIDSINEKKAFINTISMAGAKTNFKASAQSSIQLQESSFLEEGRRKKQNNRNNINLLKAVFFVLLLLLIGASIYYLTQKSHTAFPPPAEDKVTIIEEQPKPTVPINKELIPTPNIMLNENDNKIVFKNLKPSMELNDVVKVIFANNPIEVESVYKDQVESYSKYLLNLNRDCFKQYNEKFYLIKDTLINIPSYKRNAQ